MLATAAAAAGSVPLDLRAEAGAADALAVAITGTMVLMAFLLQVAPAAGIASLQAQNDCADRPGFRKCQGRHTAADLIGHMAFYGGRSII